MPQYLPFYFFSKSRKSIKTSTGHPQPEGLCSFRLIYKGVLEEVEIEDKSIQCADQVKIQWYIFK